MSARIPQWLRTALYWVLAAEFFVGFATKFWPGPTFFGPAYSVKFVDWGFPAWFRFVAGAIELICAILLVIPDKRFRFIGATSLVFLLTAAVTTHLIDDAPLYEEVSAPVHLVITAMVALANWPAHWKDLIRPRRDARAVPTGARGVEHSTP